MFTADQFFAHLVGDYVLQSTWMATHKTRSLWVALVHALAYGLPFLALGANWRAWAVIVVTHALIDRYRLARFIAWGKNWLGPGNAPWADCAATGYPSSVPIWLSTWLMILTDNTLHLLVNALALRFL